MLMVFTCDQQNCSLMGCGNQVITFSVSVSILTNKQTKKLKTKEFEEEKNYRLDFGKKRSEKMWEIREFRKKKKKKSVNGLGFFQ